MWFAAMAPKLCRLDPPENNDYRDKFYHDGTVECEPLRRGWQECSGASSRRSGWSMLLRCGSAVGVGLRTFMPFPLFADQPADAGPITISATGLNTTFTPQSTATSFQVDLPSGSIAPGTFYDQRTGRDWLGRILRSAAGPPG